MISVEDRLAIYEVMALYGHVIDWREWSRFREVFVEDLVMDWTDLPIKSMSCGWCVQIFAHRRSPSLSFSFSRDRPIRRAEAAVSRRFREVAAGPARELLPTR